MIYFTSDLHLNHSNVCEFTDRPWSQEENADMLVSIINRRAGENDLLYSLGDFSFVGPTKAKLVEDVVRRIKPKVEFLLGNHDDARLFHSLHALMPHKVMGVSHYKEIKYGKKKIVLCHYPIFSWNNMQHGSWHLHGHTHGSIDLHGKSLDVGIDSIYNLFGKHDIISVDEVGKYMKAREISTDGGHH